MKTKINAKKYNQTRNYWFTRRSYKLCWQKIQNIHMELIHQISTRIVEYAKYTKTDVICFEDLRWSKHSSKSEVGYFLSTWQVHWFFSQIIEFTARLARRHGIRLFLVNPKESSQLCSSCGMHGRRKGKTFWCQNKSCNLQIDSDLNAARNLGKFNRKHIPVRL